MNLWCIIFLCILSLIVITYFLIELHYFIRMSLCVLSARFLKKKIDILETTSVTGICFSSDVDTFLFHMNNARYFREIDFARADFYERTRLYKQIVSKGGSVVQGASTIRYRKFIRPFSFFKITSKIIYWDDQSIYMEHRFIDPKDDFINCIAVCKQRLVNCSADEIISCLFKNELNEIQPSYPSTLPSKENASQDELQPYDNVVLTEMPYCLEKPNVPLHIQKWIEYNEISSKDLRKEC